MNETKLLKVELLRDQKPDSIIVLHVKSENISKMRSLISRYNATEARPQGFEVSTTYNYKDELLQIKKTLRCEFRYSKNNHEARPEN